MTQIQVYLRLMKDIRVLHKHCITNHMTEKEKDVWTTYNRLFHPEKYIAEDLKNEKDS